MLCELRIKNLALIDSLNLCFEQADRSGLVVMTGETGAGKSIMLRALTLLTGQRGSADWIRNGAENLEVEALFEVPSDHLEVLDALEAGGFGRDTSLIIKRLVGVNGRSRYYLNGSLATAKIVADITANLLNIAGQHDQQQLLQPAMHLDFLDTLGDLWSLRQEVARSYARWQETLTTLQGLKDRDKAKEQKRDFLTFQAEEIAQAMIQPGEDENLVAEKKRLKNGEALIRISQESYRILSHELAGGLATLRQNMAQLAALDSEAAGLADVISNYTYLAEDHEKELRSYRDSLDNDPYRLDQVTERLDLLQQLKRKYGETLQEVLAYHDDCLHQLQELEDLDREISRVTELVASLQNQVFLLADRLSAARRQVAGEMELAMQRELADLSFIDTGFLVYWQEIERKAENLRALGWDRGEFYFRANPGEEPKPLARVASGGELSRLLLALKCLLARRDKVETIVFDEVDAGIGGEAAEAVARKIQQLSGHHQVFCITHLPQIAARGDMHLQVKKLVRDGRTQTDVQLLSQEMRVQELVRMMAGGSATRQTEAWAEALLAQGGAGA